MFTLKVVVAGIMLAAPHQHVRTTFSIPFDTRYTCEEQLERLPDVRNTIIALARKRQPMKLEAFGAACAETGTSRI